MSAPESWRTLSCSSPVALTTSIGLMPYPFRNAAITFSRDVCTLRAIFGAPATATVPRSELSW
jgi:hypothetical protein